MATTNDFPQQTQRGAQILFVDHASKPGGGQLGLARYLAQSSHGGLRVAVGGSDGAFGQLENDSVRTEPLPEPRGVLGTLRFMRRLAATLRSSRGAVVVANSTKSIVLVGLLPRLRGGPRVAYLRDDLNTERHSLVRKYAIGLLLRRRYDNIIANSPWTASTLPFDLERETSIAYPVSGISESWPNSPIPKDTLKLLSLSRIVEWKGLHVLMDALGQIDPSSNSKRIKLTVAGSSLYASDRYEKGIREAASKLSVEVEFVGHVDDVSELLSTHDALILCSVSPEPFGQVVAQGMASGLLTIAPDAGGPRDMIVDEVSGRLFAPGDSSALARVIVWAVRNPHDVVRIRHRAAIAAKAFSDRTTVENMDTLLSAIMRKAA